MINKMKELFKEAHEKINETEAAKESLKVGTLRAGSSGALVGDKAIYANCGRLAQARLLGHQTPTTENQRVMFVGGLALEDYVEERFKVLKLVYEKEQPFEGEIGEGIVVSGRPDFEVIIELNGIKKLVGVEVKSLASPFSGMKLYKNFAPFMKHMVQSATYMMLKRRDEWLIIVGHTFNINQNGKKHDSSVNWFYMTSVGDEFYIESETGYKSKLPFDKSHVIAYYKEVRGKVDTKELMPRPTELELNIDTYNRCNYCPMRSACNEYDVGQITFEQWLERVKQTKESEK